MKAWHILLLAATLWVAYPYLRCFCKRLRAAWKIKRICQRKAYTLHKTHPFWLLGHKRYRRCDAYIETECQIYAIKFFGTPKRTVTLVLREDGQYSFRQHVAFLTNIGFAMRIPVDGKPKPLPAYDFRYKYRDEWEIKSPRRILLVHPVSMDINYLPKNGREVPVGVGEAVNGMEIYSLPRLLGEWEAAI